MYRFDKKLIYCIYVRININTKKNRIKKNLVFETSILKSNQVTQFI